METKDPVQELASAKARITELEGGFHLLDTILRVPVAAEVYEMRAALAVVDRVLNPSQSTKGGVSDPSHTFDPTDHDTGC